MTESNPSIAQANFMAEALSQIVDAGHVNDWNDDSYEVDRQDFEDSVSANESEYLNYSQEQ